MACTLHVGKDKLFDCTCADTNFSHAVEKVRIAFHATHYPGSYGDHSKCCEQFDKACDQVRRMELNPNFWEEDYYERRAKLAEKDITND